MEKLFRHEGQLAGDPHPSVIRSIAESHKAGAPHSEKKGYQNGALGVLLLQMVLIFGHRKRHTL